MKKTISLLTILALVSVSGCNCTPKTANEKTAAIKSETVIAVNSASATKADTRVVHPASTVVADFEKQVANGIVILDFFAVWCPPCKRFGPIFAKTADKAAHADKLFIKIDIEQFASLTDKYGVRSMPTIIALKDGKEVKRTTGAMSEGQFENWLKGL
jgi:Thioredoxin domain-containing protein